jgi:ATP-dependent protease ClpP protease subunit
MQLLVEAKENRADLYISGDITRGVQFWGMTFKNDTDVEYNDVAEALADLPSNVTEIGVHINSYGGEVAEGVAIYNALKAHSAHVTTVCEGFACSIASVVFMAGDDRIMRDSSLLMLHNASMPAYGDANDHRKAAEDLEVITELSKTAYLSHATEALTREKLTEIMDAETWVTAEQALEWGLCTEIDKANEDEEEPTQSARNLVMRSLTSPLACVKFMPATELKTKITELKADVVPTRVNPLDQINERLDKIEELFTRMDELEALIAKQEVTETPIIVDEVDEDAKRTYSERLAQIFNQLASNK